MVLQGVRCERQDRRELRGLRRPWVWKLWRPSKRVVRGVKVVWRHGCTSREATWAPRWGSTRWWKVIIIIVIVVSVVAIGGRWCAIGWLRSPCRRRCILRRVFVRQRVPSSKRSPIDDVFSLDLVDGVRGYLGFVILRILCVVVSVTPEKVVVAVWVPSADICLVNNSSRDWDTVLIFNATKIGLIQKSSLSHRQKNCHPQLDQEHENHYLKI